MKAVESSVSFPKLEEKILQFWKDEQVFQDSLDKRLPTELDQEKSDTDRKSYVFYDGPPFATGLPHYGHLLAGTIKDVVGRFFSMKGFHVDRRFGWDCHGVPVEFEIQKKLDLHGAKAIKEFGIGNFNEACREIVLRYTKEWEEFVERSGRWVDFDRQYRTMDLEFMESIWWVVKSLWDKDLIYEGVKCVPYSWAMNTPLSNFEANLNYKTVQDPAVTIRVKLKSPLEQAKGKDSFLYLWTTTPWTLPSNMAVAVGEALQYSLVEDSEKNEVYVVASELLERHFPELEGEEKSGVQVIGTLEGKDLLGLEYEPLFPYFSEESKNNAFRVYAGEFVTAEDGTGLVHLASFGEDDLSVFQREGIKIIDPVDDDGCFTEQVSDFSGLNVKEADSKIIAHLKKEAKLVKHSTLEHSYPFCWRTDTPLIYKSIPTWFVKVESFREELQQINSIIHWVPEHLREGRMGKWLEGARDWAISRNRYWGTPIPVWRCQKCSGIKCIGSVSELSELSGRKIDDLHRHFIDDIEIDCDKCSGKMGRIPEVLDCWFESGSMPYAQSHYPFESKQEFEENFPADFIAEGLDQTRGWFYTLLILSTALFGRPAFKNVVVNGIVLAEDGKKMSKSLKNYPPPDEVMNEFGADAMRLYLLASAATRAEELRFSKEGVKQVVRQTILPLWNAYNFFVTYALVDEWSVDKAPKEESTNLLDRWILSKMGSLVSRVDTAMEAYHLYASVQPVLEFVDQLTNWYIRLNRRRFWAGNTAEEKLDKCHAYNTLYRVLTMFSRVLAPLAPFVTEEIFQNLSADNKNIKAKSVHLTPFPKVSELEGVEIDSKLEEAMELFEEVILLGRGLRNDKGLKVRQPLQKIIVIHPEGEMLEGVKEFHSYICEELNLKDVEYTTDEKKHVDLTAKLNTKALGKVLGPKLGSDGMKELRKLVEGLSDKEISNIESGEALKFRDLEIGLADIIITRKSKSTSDAAASSGRISIVLDTVLTPELRMEGLAREFVNRIQRMRKDLDFHVSDRVVISYLTASAKVAMAVTEFRDYVMKETLAVEVVEANSESDLVSASGTHKTIEQEPVVQEIDGESVVIGLERIQS